MTGPTVHPFIWEVGGAYLRSVRIGYATESSIGMVLSGFTRLSDFPASRACFFEGFFVFVCFIGIASPFFDLPWCKLQAGSMWTAA
jgi:hypothetical protein